MARAGRRRIPRPQRWQTLDGKVVGLRATSSPPWLVADMEGDGQSPAVIYWQQRCLGAEAAYRKAYQDWVALREKLDVIHGLARRDAET